MRQLSLLTLTDDYAHLAGLMPAVRGAMRRAAGADEGEGRKALVDSINRIGPAISSDDAAFFERYGGTPERDAQEKLFHYFGNRQNTAIAL